MDKKRRRRKHTDGNDESLDAGKQDGPKSHSKITHVQGSMEGKPSLLLADLSVFPVNTQQRVRELRHRLAVACRQFVSELDLESLLPQTTNELDRPEYQPDSTHRPFETQLVWKSASPSSSSSKPPAGPVSASNFRKRKRKSSPGNTSTSTFADTSMDTPANTSSVPTLFAPAKDLLARLEQQEEAAQSPPSHSDSDSDSDSSTESSSSMPSHEQEKREAELKKHYDQVSSPSQGDDDDNSDVPNRGMPTIPYETGETAEAAARGDASVSPHPPYFQPQNGDGGDHPPSSVTSSNSSENTASTLQSQWQPQAQTQPEHTLDHSPTESRQVDSTQIPVASVNGAQKDHDEAKADSNTPDSSSSLTSSDDDATANANANANATETTMSSTIPTTANSHKPAQADASSSDSSDDEENVQMPTLSQPSPGSPKKPGKTKSSAPRTKGPLGQGYSLASLFEEQNRRRGSRSNSPAAGGDISAHLAAARRANATSTPVQGNSSSSSSSSASSSESDEADNAANLSASQKLARARMKQRSKR